MKFLFSFLFLCLGGNLLAQTSYIPSTQVLKKKGYQLAVGGDYFNTSTRVDSEGTKKDFEEGEKFSRIQGEFNASYGATDEFQLSFGVRGRQNQGTFLAGSNNPINASSSGLQSTWAGFHYAFSPVGKFQYTLEGLYRFTPYTNEDYDPNKLENIILGDDGNEWQAGLGVTYTFPGHNFLTLRGGYRMPGKDLSDELYWQAEGALVWRHVALIAGVDGVTSLSNDDYSADPLKKTRLNTGGTYLYNSINREWIAPYAGINVALGTQWRLELRGGQVMRGLSTDLGTSFSAFLVRRADQSPSKHPDKRFKAYDFEANVIKISPQRNYVVIDRGLSGDIQKGMAIDIYEFDYIGGNILVARGTVVKVKVESSIVKVTHHFNTRKELKEGLLARGSFK